MACWDGGKANDLPGKHLVVVPMRNAQACSLTTAHKVVCSRRGQARAVEELPEEYEDLLGNESILCGIKRDGSSACTGDSDYEEFLASGPFTAERNVRSLALLSHSGCGVREDRTVGCWGREGEVAPAPQGTFKAITAAKEGFCGLRDPGDVVCWAKEKAEFAPRGTFVNLGRGDGRNDYACGIEANGTVACFGSDRAQSPSGRYVFER